MSGSGRPAIRRTAAICGMIGSCMLVSVVAILSIVQYEFMLSIGWRPLSDPGGAWPSGLALGPHGWLMDAAFALSGILLVVFAFGLRRELQSRVGAGVLLVSGVALSLLAFETDPIMRVGPRSVHGFIHDAAFVVFALSMLSSIFFLWHAMRRIPGWLGYSQYTLLTGVICVIALVVSGFAYYLFVIALAGWMFSTALKLYRNNDHGRTV